jgi:ribokinase
MDILCVGDAKLDIFLLVPQTDPNFSLDKEKKQLTIDFGDKIYIEKYTVGVGGNATNTAVGISRLGLSAGLCAEIGKDEFSSKITDKLKEENVNTKLLFQNNKGKTSISVALSYKGERTLFTEHFKRNHEFDFEKTETRMVYLTSLGEIWENAYQNVLEYITKKSIPLAFNPGTLQIEKRDKLIMDIIDKTTYLFVNKEEAQRLLYGNELGIETDNASLIKKLLFGLKSLGAKNIIITDSSNGSFIQKEDGDMLHFPVIPVEVLEMTGAGDSYASGFLAAVLNGKKENEAMKWGTIEASNVIQKVGAQEGLLNKPEMEKELKNVQASPENY